MRASGKTVKSFQCRGDKLKKSILSIVGVMAVAVSSFAQVQTNCTDIAGNIACTSYDQGASSQSYCTSIAGNLSCTTYSTGYTKPQIRQNYESGQVFGTALGQTIMSAIAAHNAKKRAKQSKQEVWDQFVQDTLATADLSCETDLKHELTVVQCRTEVFSFNQFLHKHPKDFVADGNNVSLLADALESTAPPDQSTWTEETYEAAFRTIDKKKLDKKVYLGLGANRTRW
jgi:hypothetical protein